MDAMPPPGMVPAIDRFQQGYEGPLVYTNSHGIEIFGTAKQIPLANWRVVSNLPTAEAFSPIREMRHRMLIATLLLTVLAGTLTWWVVRRQLAPIIDTAKSLARMATTNQPLQALPVDRHDEIGQMVAGFNSLLKTLSIREPVSYTHLDVYKRQEWKYLFSNPIRCSILSFSGRLAVRRQKIRLSRVP